MSFTAKCTCGTSWRVGRGKKPRHSVVLDGCVACSGNWTPAARKRTRIEARIIQAARDMRRLEKERPGKLEACEVYEYDEPDHTTGYPGYGRPACPDARDTDTDHDGSTIGNGPLAFADWCSGCRARHHTSQALYAARRRLRTAIDALERLEDRS